MFGFVEFLFNFVDKISAVPLTFSGNPLNVFRVDADSCNFRFHDVQFFFYKDSSSKPNLLDTSSLLRHKNLSTSATKAMVLSHIPNVQSIIKPSHGMLVCLKKAGAKDWLFLTAPNGFWKS